jgi:hypothetical protein
MTTTDHKTEPEPAEARDGLRRFFEELGIPTLTWHLDQAMAEMSDEGMVNYAKVAGAVTRGPRLVRERTGEDMNEAMRLAWAGIVLSVLTGEGLTEDEDGEVWGTNLAGEPIMLTPEVVRHATFMWELFDSQEVAARFLAACPEQVRSIAEEAVARAWMMRFEEVVGRA